MANQQDKQLILQILLEDLEAIQVSKKGKRRADQPSDLEVAISSMREDLQNTQISMHDQVLAHSTSSAILTDQNALMEAKEEEWVANQDHRLAADLSNGRRTPRPREAEKKPRPDDDNDDVVSVIMEDLMSRVSLTERSDNGEGSSRSPHAYKPAPRRIICASCLERRGAVSTSLLRQCHTPAVAMQVLNYQELRAFSERALEWTAKDRVYCADPTCSAFIPAFHIKDEHGTCPKCRKKTHLPCRSLAHPAVDCPMDENLPAVLEIAEAEGWKRCPHCRTMVELSRGCNHMTCRFWTKRTNSLKKKCRKTLLQQTDNVHWIMRLKTCCIMRS
ncbi:uncharacterized protein N7506_006266 [Penicillium brevicompactum]|uniref:uncharacterized protein n=1 Tax=Penicillium brevicompactum TaxID=5074 RepID=UPI00253FB0DB|nr:uncharacterized protein N7506_006266 [Penicillium brevicompactum]KAJ5332483.1 hypothetical protein N7506_006266 [Penicillium brevicompactum]